MKNLEQLFGKKMNIRLPADERGYIGRECPACKYYFKIVNGTGIRGATASYCPYCGHHSSHKEFNIKEQVEYVKSVAFRAMTDALHADLKKAEFSIKPRGSFGIGMKMKVTRGHVPPIRRYFEKELETHIKCDDCTLKYAVYGVFAFCPDCGRHNNLQILERNLDLIGRAVSLAGEQSGDLGEKLIGNALEDCVSSFDGWGREVMAAFADRATSPEKAKKIRFQNLKWASEQVKKHFGFALEDLLDADSFRDLNTLFQKRHLLEHKMGVVDDDYIKKSGDASISIGRKVRLTPGEISRAVEIIRELSTNLMERFDA